MNTRSNIIKPKSVKTTSVPKLASAKPAKQKPKKSVAPSVPQPDASQQSSQQVADDETTPKTVRLLHNQLNDCTTCNQLIDMKVIIE